MQIHIVSFSVQSIIETIRINQHLPTASTPRHFGTEPANVVVEKFRALRFNRAVPGAGNRRLRAKSAVGREKTWPRRMNSQSIASHGRDQSMVRTYNVTRHWNGDDIGGLWGEKNQINLHIRPAVRATCVCVCTCCDAVSPEQFIFVVLMINVRKRAHTRVVFNSRAHNILAVVQQGDRDRFGLSVAHYVAKTRPHTNAKYIAPGYLNGKLSAAANKSR